MTITVRQDADGSLHILNGHVRLQVQLTNRGKAQVYNVSNGTTIYVHEVEGGLAALDAVGQAMLDSVTESVIEQAKRPAE